MCIRDRLYIRHCLSFEKKILVGFGLCLSDAQKKKVEEKIDEIMQVAMPWQTRYERIQNGTLSQDCLLYTSNLKRYKPYEENDVENETVVHFEGNLRFEHTDHMISGVGNGPIDAFFNALKTVGITNYKFVSYSEHAVSEGANSKAISYIQLECPNGKMCIRDKC